MVRRWVAHWPICIASFGALASPSTLAAPGWGTECVGRYQFALPLDTEVATTSTAKMEALFGLLRNEDLPDFSFLDGEVAGYSTIVHSGRFYISNLMSDDQMRRLLSVHQTTNLSETRRRYGGRTSPDGKTYSLAPLGLNVPDASAYRFYGSNFDIAAAVGNRLVRAWVDTESLSPSEGKRRLQALIQSMHPRALFEVPATMGVCLPYLFVGDAGNRSRNVGVTYRLKTHPDVTIWVNDSDEFSSAAPGESTLAESRRDNESFWNLRYQDRKKYRFLVAHSMKLANMDGASTLVELVREDDSVDYGLYASARSPSGETIQLFVIRDGAKAIAKGIKPMEQREMKSLADAIMASVERRPTHAK